MRVLVVDDVPSIRSLLEYALGFEGYEVITAPDGANAIAHAHTHRPDAIILDVMMPRMNGYDVAERLRSDAEVSDVPIIMLTARAGDEDVLDGWRAGVDPTSRSRSTSSCSSPSSTGPPAAGSPRWRDGQDQVRISIVLAKTASDGLSSRKIP